MATDPTDVTDILTKSDLRALRKAFDNDTMIALGIKSVAGSYSRGLPVTRISGSQFYAEKGSQYASSDPELERILPRADVEKVLLAVLLVSHQRWAFAIHVYWSMMLDKRPLSPRDIAEIVLLTSMYEGIDVLSEGMNVLAAVFSMLHARVEADEPLDALSVGKALMELIPITPGVVFQTRTP